MTRRHDLGLLPVLLLAACTALAPGPRVIEVSEAQLAARIARQFPYRGRHLDVFEVVLSEPQVRLLPQDNRIGTQLRYALGGPLLGARQLAGTLSLSYGLRFEPADNSLRLAQVKVEAFEVPGLPAAWQPQVNRLGSLLAENLLRDFAVHRLRDEDLKTLRGWGMQPGALRVVPGGLQLQLDPVERR